MRLYNFLTVATALTMTLAVSAQSPATPNLSKMVNSTNVVRVQKLQKKIDEKKSLLNIENQKRNRAIDGIRIDILEGMNRSQDSLCLALQSELVALQLEYDEILPTLPVKNTPTGNPSSKIKPVKVQSSPIQNTSPISQPQTATPQSAASESKPATTSDKPTKSKITKSRKVKPLRSK